VPGRVRRFRLRARRAGMTAHYEGPYGPLDIDLNKYDKHGRQVLLRGPEIEGAELTLGPEMAGIRRAELIRKGVTAKVGDTVVRLHQPRKGFRRSRRTVVVERPGRPPAALRLRGWDNMSLERPGGGPLVRLGWFRGKIWPDADVADIALLLLADRAGMLRDVELG
jgi:hypothetical protein